jgi:hypothetical protein
MAPDLVVTVRSPALDGELTKRLEFQAREVGAAAISGTRAAVGTVYIDGHSQLSDDADWETSLWLFTEEGRARLVKAVDLIFGHLRGEFSVEAAWVGHPTKETQRISRGGLRRLILDNRLGNRIQYLVEAQPLSQIDRERP